MGFFLIRIFGIDIMKSKILCIFFFISSLGLKAQNLTDTLDSYKKVILEEFGGTTCNACPTAHQAVTSLLDTNSNVVAVNYSPANHLLAEPWNGGNDLRRNFPILLFTDPYFNNGGGLSMPSFFVNRRVFSTNTNGGRKLSTSEISAPVDSIQSEISSINIGLESLFNPATNELLVECELYFKSSTTNFLGINVIIVEDSVVANQNGTSISPYYHNHVFREALTDQYGDPILSSTNAGDYFQKSFTFNLSNSIDPLNIDNCHIIAFVYDISAAENITAVQVKAKNGTTRITPTRLEILQSKKQLSIFPNPARDEVRINFETSSNQKSQIRLLNSYGIKVRSEVLPHGQKGIILNTQDYPRGLYFILVGQGRNLIRTSLLLQ